MTNTIKLIRDLTELHFNLPSPAAPEFAELVKGINSDDWGIGTSDELAETLHAHAGFQRANEVAFALPFTFDEDDYLQIVTDMAEKLGPKLGWTPNVGSER